MKTAAKTSLERHAIRWQPTGPLPSMLAALICLSLAPAISSAAHTKAETEAPAEADAAGPLSTPKGALLAYDAALPAGGIEAAEAAYHCDNDNQRKAAHAMAEVDVATSQLQQKVKEKLGPAAMEVILHAARNVSASDVREATEKIDGDRAVITWKTKRPTVPMVKVGGKWQVSVSDVLADFGKDADLDDFVRTCGEIATEIRRTTAEFDAGEYPNVTLLQRAVSQRFFRLLGEDK